MQTLIFGGQDSVTVPVGGDIYSDLLTLNFPVTAGRDLLVSLLPGERLALTHADELLSQRRHGLVRVVVHAERDCRHNRHSVHEQRRGGFPLCGSGPHRGGCDHSSGRDRPEQSESDRVPAEPTVVVAGDNVIDGSIADAQQDAPDAPPPRGWPASSRPS